jgi:hypothetical protein
MECFILIVKIVLEDDFCSRSREIAQLITITFQMNFHMNFDASALLCTIKYR